MKLKQLIRLIIKPSFDLELNFEGMPEKHLFRLPNASGNIIMNDPNTYEFQTDGSPVLKKVEANIVEFKNNPEHPLLILPDGSIIYSSYRPNQTTILECGIDGRIKWELEVEFLRVSPVLHNNFLYMHIGFNYDSTLIKLNRKVLMCVLLKSRVYILFIQMGALYLLIPIICFIGMAKKSCLSN
jgi:hypothetical protein